MKKTLYPAILMAAIAIFCGSSFAAEAETATPTESTTSAKSESGPTGHYYVEYQVIQVPTTTIKKIREKVGSGKSLESLLPEIYESKQYRVISSTAGRIVTGEKSSFRMVKEEFFPSSYLLPNPDPELIPETEEEDDDTEEETPTTPTVSMTRTDNKTDTADKEDDEKNAEEPEEKEEEAESTVLVVVGPKDRTEEEEEEDYESDDEEEEDGEESEEEEENAEPFNNLEGPFPIFKNKPDSAGNDFTLKAYRDETTHTFDLRSIVQKNTGSTYMDYGEWGRAQLPAWEASSMSSIFQTENGLLGLLSSAPAGSTNTTLHVFYMRMLSEGEEALLKPELKQQLNITVRVVRTSWRDYFTAADSDGRPVLPSEDIFPKLEKAKSFKLISESSFKVMSGKTVSSSDNSSTVAFSTDYRPGTKPGEAATPSGTGTFTKGTKVTITPTMLEDSDMLRLHWHYERGEQLGQKSYSYRYWSAVKQEGEIQFKYAMDARNPENGERGTFNLPIVEQNEIEQTTYVPIGKFILMSKISNPSFQADAVTMYFVKVEKSGATTDAEQKK